MQGKTILVVDDDEVFTDMLSEILTEEGFVVLVEHNGASGLQSALTQHPALVLFDMLMPQMTGVVALTKLREDAWGKDVPAILLTNMSESEVVEKKDGVVGYTECLLKTDWTLEKLAEHIKEILA